MTTQGISNFSVDDAISYWTNLVGAHIIEYNSITKKTFHTSWSTENDTNVDYKFNLKRRVYNDGIAVRTGKLNRGPYKDYYLCCIDFDSLEAFLIWCDGEYNLDDLAKWTRVEWHKDPERIHVFFLSKTPLTDVTRNKENNVIEVYGKNPHLVCVYGVHGDGNHIQVYDNEKIAVIDELTRLDIDSRTRLVLSNFTDDSVRKYVEELEKDETIVPKGIVHNATRTMLMSVYFRYQGKFALMSDEQRFQYVVDWDRQKAVQAGRPAYIEANPKKLQELWEGIKKKFHSQREKERNKRRAEYESAKQTRGKKNKKGNSGERPPEENGTQLDEIILHKACQAVAPFINEEFLLSNIFRFFHHYDLSQESCIAIIDELVKEEEVRRYKVDMLKQVYDGNYQFEKDFTTIYLLDIIKDSHGLFVARKTMEGLVRIVTISAESMIRWLSDIMLKEHHFATMEDSEEIYYYKEGVFIKNGVPTIKKHIELLYPIATTYEMSEIINRVRRNTFAARSEFDNNIDIINTKDCALNIHTLEVMPHSPKFLSLSKLPVKYDPNANCPRILEFFNQVLRREDIPIVLQMIGYCLYRTSIYQKAFMLFGRDGSNGKSVLLNIIEALLGSLNCSDRSLQDLDNNRFAVADLYGKMANLFADLKKTKLIETGNFKILTSGDETTGRHKFGQPFKFRNHATMIFSSNLIPESEDKTDSYYRRWVIIPFDKRFADGEEDPQLTELLKHEMICEYH